MFRLKIDFFYCFELSPYRSAYIIFPAACWYIKNNARKIIFRIITIYNWGLNCSAIYTGPSTVRKIHFRHTASYYQISVQLSSLRNAARSIVVTLSGIIRLPVSLLQ